MSIPKMRQWTQEEVMEDFSYGTDGHLVWNHGPRRGKVAGWTDAQGYLLIRYKGVLVRAHNLVWLLYYGAWPTFEIDHINNNTSDNTIFNLRSSDRMSNGANQKLQTRRAGKFKGVYENASGYYVKIKRNGKQVYVGSYKTEAQAAKAYNEAAIFMFGEFAKLNDI